MSCLEHLHESLHEVLSVMEGWRDGWMDRFRSFKTLLFHMEWAAISVQIGHLCWQILIITFAMIA